MHTYVVNSRTNGFTVNLCCIVFSGSVCVVDFIFFQVTQTADIYVSIQTMNALYLVLPYYYTYVYTTFVEQYYYNHIRAQMNTRLFGKHLYSEIQIQF